MADTTGIEWTDATWSPVTGCTRVSDGCTHCYIERTPPFRINHRRFDGDGTGATTGVLLHPERLDIPLRWRKPRKVFVCSMADLFHDDVSDDYIAQVFATMALAPQHTFQVLTKRHARMRSLLNNNAFLTEVCEHGEWIARHWTTALDDSIFRRGPWPLPNVWLGVSAEDQQRADVRIPALLDTPAAVRFISAEPLLGPIALHPYWTHGRPGWGDPEPQPCPNGGTISMQPLEVGPHLDWVIVGGESGPGARPMHPDWARSLRDQCTEAGVAFLFKQWGEYRTADRGDDVMSMTCVQASTGVAVKHGQDPAIQAPGGWSAMRRVGKKAAGRILDGRTWDQYPVAMGAM